MELNNELLFINWIEINKLNEGIANLKMIAILLN